jgi:hypothetical protein
MSTTKEMSAKLDECLLQVARLIEELVETRKQRDDAVAELAHTREQLASTLCVIEQATIAAAEGEIVEILNASLVDAQAGDMLVVRIDDLDAEAIRSGADQITVMRSDMQGFLDSIDRSMQRDLARESA